MTYPAALLIHTATLETGETAGTVDAYGVAAVTKTTASVSCRFGKGFGKAKESYPRTSAGPMPDRSVSCIVPAGSLVAVGRRITGPAPFNQSYQITAVTPAYVATSISHLVLTLEVAGV